MKHNRLTMIVPAMIIVSALLFVLAGCSGKNVETTSSSQSTVQTPAENTAVTAEETEDEYFRAEEPVEKLPIFSETLGNIRVQIYSDDVLRVEKKGEKGFEDRDTLVVLNRTDWNGCNVEREEENGIVSFSTKSFVLRLEKDAEDLASLELYDAGGEKLLKKYKDVSSLTSTVALPSPSTKNKVWCFNDNPRVTPSENGFRAPESKEVYEENNGWECESKVEDFYFFLSIGDSFAFRENFVNLTGGSDMISLKNLGLWFSRWNNYKDSEVLALIDKFREEGYPIDMFTVDTDWRSSSDGTGYTVNRSSFPNINKFFNDAHQKNVYITMNDHVHASTKSMLSYEQLSWFNKGLVKNLNSGLDGWWYDRNWQYKLISPFPSVHGDLMGQLLYLDIMENWKGDKNNSRTFMLSNVYTIQNGTYSSSAAHLALHRNSIQWTGDIASSAGALKNEIVNLVRSGVDYSLGFYSSDIGGFLGCPDEPLFIRWTQYGCFSPIMRYHSAYQYTREPWTVSDLANEVAREYVNMRYRLMPLFYTLAYENTAKGLPIARRLDFCYPDDKLAADNSEYLLGDDIIVAPYMDPTGKSSSKIIYETKDGETGLSGKYYSGTHPSGNVIYEKIAKEINFDWGNGSPDSKVPADRFSVCWEGYITSEDEDVRLAVLSDDGIRVYLDGETIIDNWQANDSVTTISTFVLKKGTRYEIKVEYYEDGGGAKVKMYPVIADPNLITETRKVHIPEGEWINVFTGEEISGPVDINVTMSIKQMPVFIKKGSTTVLSPAHDHLDSSDWENIVLDIFSAKGTKDTTVHYEDDGLTEDYKSGEYRITTYKTVWDENGKMTLKASSVTGNGKNPCSFENRNITLRIHAEKLTTVKVNGEKVDFTVIEKDETKYPFAVDGASPDSRVYTVTFTLPVAENYTVTAE